MEGEGLSSCENSSYNLPELLNFQGVWYGMLSFFDFVTP